MSDLRTARRAALALLWAVALAGALGCTNDPTRQPVWPVWGQVRVDGRPLEQGYVVFSPEPARDTVGPPARAVVLAGNDGRYMLSTYTLYDGAVAGWHRVAIHRFDSPAETSPELLPARFHAASELRVQVRAGRGNAIHFHLWTAPTSQPVIQTDP